MAFGMLYLFFTLIVEYFLWLEPLSRTILFWLFVTIEFILLFRFILIPVFKLFGIRKGISETEASRIIGRHFKEVDDKLTNIIQLKSRGVGNELLEASIEQKSRELQPISFKRAIVFKSNAVYLKYLLVPLVIWFLVWITGNNSVFTQSLNRVVHHQTAFEAPAPFYFEVLNDNLQTIQDESYILKFRTIGALVPENIRISYEGNSYYISPGEDGISSYTFEFPEKEIQFYMEGNAVRSKPYVLKVLAAPKITGFSMELIYPSYLNKPTDTISNTGNAVIPVGTEVRWLVSSSRKTSYEIRSSNDYLKEYETLSYQLEVVNDEYPKIFVQSDIDSVTRGPVQFRGQLTDDYGVSRLQVVAKDKTSGKLSIGTI